MTTEQLIDAKTTKMGLARGQWLRTLAAIRGLPTFTPRVR